MQNLILGDTRSWPPITPNAYDDIRGGGHANLAAFTLHQAAERLYHCVFLVLALYTQRIKVLRSKAEDLDKRLIEAWSRDNRIARRFEFLSRAYVEVQYSPNYEISAEDLA